MLAQNGGLMTAKPTYYFWIILLALLTACGTAPQSDEMTKVQNAALAMARTGVALTQTAMPTSTLPPPTFTPTATIVYPISTPIPTQPPIPIFTPDAIQVERWKEYENALAKALVRSSFIPDQFLCEWEILGRSAQEVYVWMTCASIFSAEVVGDTLAVIHIGTDGTVQIVETPAWPLDGVFNWGANIRRMFPLYVQERYFSGLIHFQELKDHLLWRLERLEEPPLVVLSAMPKVTATPSPIPTQPPPPIFTPDVIQVERWKEYQTELAKVLLYGYGPDAYKDALCEWDILEHSDQKVYVWAYCAPAGGGSGSLPAVIQFKNDGAVQKVSAPAINNSTWDSQIRKMFPVVVQEKLDLYYFNVCVYCGRPEELRLHLLYRQTHPEIPPLIVLSAIPTATPLP
jgi:hypothetical protein